MVLPFIYISYLKPALSHNYYLVNVNVLRLKYCVKGHNATPDMKVIQQFFNQKISGSLNYS